MDSTIFWVLLVAWAGTCIIYFSRIRRIAKSSRLSVFSPLNKYSDTVRALIKSLYTRIFVITIVFIITLLITFFVRSSTDVGY